jgi:bifunctional UDP-N-acetylglucosamine pyrophosphorylase/glucosamine-1-phosphate N-acetyltransferase
MPLDVVILAAGQGSRMHSDIPKVLHRLAGKPLLAHVLDTASALDPRSITVVYGHGGEQVRAALSTDAVCWVEQTERLGTGHAVRTALPALPEGGTVLILYGDVPLLTPVTLSRLIEQAAEGPALLTTVLDQPKGYGRIIRLSSGHFLRVVEEKDASATERQITEINTGVLAIPHQQLQEWLPKVGNANAQGEYYLPDVLSFAVNHGVIVKTQQAPADDVQGVNDRKQLADAERLLQRRLADQQLLRGVSLADPARIDIRGELRCGRDVFIDANVVIEGLVVLGDRVRIGPNVVLKDVTVGDDAHIEAFSHLADSRLGQGVAVGPFARVRGGAELGDHAKLGNFVELKNAQFGAGSKANHLAYLGDCRLGRGVNIGAGTITCNYDGAHKHRTEMGDHVFVGSNSTLVAPLRIEDNGFIGAGSTITQTVEQGHLAVGRARQRNIPGWKRPQKTDKP